MYKSQPFNHFLQHTHSSGITAKLANVVINERNLTRINREKYVWAVDAIVLNLFTAYFESSKKVVGISRDKNYWDGKDKFYKNSKLTFTTVITSLDILEKHKYIKLVEEGKQGFGDKPGTTSRYKANRKLIKLYKDWDWNIYDVSDYKDAPSVRLRGKKPKRTLLNPFPKGKLIPFKSNSRIDLMHRVLDLLNRNFRTTDINLYLSKQEEKVLNQRMAASAQEDEDYADRIRYQNKYLYRVFNEDFESGGRFYGGFWQQLPSEYRSRLIIDGFYTAEMDYSSIHFAMLYNYEGYNKEDFKDPYTLKTEDDELRKAIKTTMNIMLNTSSYEDALVVCRKHEMKLPKKFYKTWKALIDDILEHHHPIKDYFFTQIGTQLQKLDSDIAEYVLVTMTNEHGVCVLPIHDSFVCPIKDLKALIEVMHIAAKKVANLSLYLEPKFSQKNFKGYGEKIFKLDESNYYQRRTKFLESVDLYYLNEPPSFV